MIILVPPITKPSLHLLPSDVQTTHTFQFTCQVMGGSSPYQAVGWFLPCSPPAAQASAPNASLSFNSGTGQKKGLSPPCLHEVAAAAAISTGSSLARLPTVVQETSPRQCPPHTILRAASAVASQCQQNSRAGIVKQLGKGMPFPWQRAV